MSIFLKRLHTNVLKQDHWLPEDLGEKVQFRGWPICQDVFIVHFTVAAHAPALPPGVCLQEMFTQRWKSALLTPPVRSEAAWGQVTPCTAAGTIVLGFHLSVILLGRGRVLFDLLEPEWLLDFLQSAAVRSFWVTHFS